MVAIITKIKITSRLIITIISIKIIIYSANINDLCAKYTAWCMLNCIVINANKSNFLSFNVTDIVVNLSGRTIENLHVVKYLDIFIDDKLTWSKQVDVVVKKYCHRIGLFKKVLPYLTNDRALL